MSFKTNFHKYTSHLNILALVLVLAIPASPAFAKPLKLKDELTVSGRFELPKAKPSLQNTLQVNPKIQMDEETRKTLANIMKLSPEELDLMLLESFEKSLINYGYVAPRPVSEDTLESEEITNGQALEGENKSAIIVKIDSIEFEEKDDDTLSIVKLSVDGPQSCLTATTESNFLALKRKDSQRGRKVFAWVGGIAVGALTQDLSNVESYSITNGSLFLQGQLNEASRLNKVNIYGKETAIGESYPPKKGKRTAKRHAVKNAIRLNYARYISLIGQTCD